MEQKNRWRPSLGFVVSLAIIALPFIYFEAHKYYWRWSSDRSAAVILETCLSAQDDFRSNDRDQDSLEMYWVKDVAGLYGFDPGKGPISLIDKKTAQADRTPEGDNYASIIEKKQFIGYYFGALKSYREDGKSVPYDDGMGRNPSRFGFLAYPAEKSADEIALGTLTFITNEKGTTYSKNTGGKPVWEFPEDPIAEGWAVFDKLAIYED